MQVRDSANVGFTPRSLDLGTHLWDTEVPFELTFTNGTTEPIEITSTRASCSCLMLDADAVRGRIVQPGQAIPISGLLDTGMHPGVLTRRITLGTTNGEYSAEVMLAVEGTWTISADAVDFGEIPLGDPETLTVSKEIVFEARPDCLLGSPEPTVEWIKCHASVVTKETTRLVIEVDPLLLPAGTSAGAIVLRTTSSVRPNTTVYVRARGMSVLTAQPAVVFLQGVQPRRVKIVGRDSEAVTVAEATCDDPSLQVCILEGGVIELSNPVGNAMLAARHVRVTDSTGRSVEIVVSAY
ncbi:MAG: DUF1573 domain-containing protein [Phycisphaerae bacterium]|nr:DUF1573 domain-containing protein [Phycisphaerae bacterium]